MKKCCGNCAHALNVRVSIKDGDMVGQCRRFPPQFDPVYAARLNNIDAGTEHHTCFVFPVVDAEDWFCGEFIPRTNKIGELDPRVPENKQVAEELTK